MNETTPEINLDRIGSREILDTLADGAYITDTSRKIVFWNHTAEQITGWPARQVIGCHCADNILAHVDLDGHALCGTEHCPLYRAMETGETSVEPMLIFARHKDGHRIPVEVSVAPILDGDRIVGGIELFRDLTVMVDDLRRARLIQEHVLACHLPDDPRVSFQVIYSPEEIVGGDFYRLEPIDADRYAILVADVMGHGAASALYTMQLRMVWDDCRHLLVSPHAFLGELNHRLGQLAGAEGYFATANFVTLDLARGECAYVCAGHPPPVIFRANGKVQPLDYRSPGIGLFDQVSYVEATERLEPGDTMLLFSDGAVEITNRAGHELGLEGFLGLLAEQDFGRGNASLEQVQRALLKFSDRIRLPDDLTLLSIHRVGNTPAKS